MITLDQNTEDFANRFRDLLNANFLLISAGVDPEDPVIDMSVLAFFEQYAVTTPAPATIDVEAPVKASVPAAPVFEAPHVQGVAVTDLMNIQMGYVIKFKDTNSIARRFDGQLFQSVEAAELTLSTIGTKDAQSAYAIVAVYT